MCWVGRIPFEAIAQGGDRVVKKGQKQIRSAGAYFLEHGEKSNPENVPASS